MKVLLSAYACEPNKGSEPGVGWNWAVEVERLGHQVWVLTRENNKTVIDDYWHENTKPSNLNFIYYDLPKWLSWWKKGGRGVHLYYFLWQIGAFFIARAKHKEIEFEKAQHITFVTVRQPSFMGFLGIPFTFGPVGGGERAPFRLRKSFPFKGKVKDLLRDFANLLVKFDPFMYLTFAMANDIYVTSEQSKQIIPRYFRKKVKVQIAIGYSGNTTKIIKSRDTNNIIFVGRFEYWKGMGLGLRAFSLFVRYKPDATLTMIGKGPDKEHWLLLAENLGVSQQVTWIEWVDQAKLNDLYKSHDLFLFPSLHDSGGMVVLEAMAQALPVVCLNLGGPGIIVDKSCGSNISVAGKDENQVVEDINRALVSFASNSANKNVLSNGALIKAGELSWAAAVKSVYECEN